MKVLKLEMRLSFGFILTQMLCVCVYKESVTSSLCFPWSRPGVWSHQTLGTHYQTTLTSELAAESCTGGGSSDRRSMSVMWRLSPYWQISASDTVCSEAMFSITHKQVSGSVWKQLWATCNDTFLWVCVYGEPLQCDDRFKGGIPTESSVNTLQFAVLSFTFSFILSVNLLQPCITFTVYMQQSACFMSLS